MASKLIGIVKDGGKQMGIKEKIESAKKVNWVSEGISESEVKTTIELAKISAKIERARLELGMTQKEFANYMGVTQGMISKWESREYNFTVRSLNEICQKLGFSLSVSMEKSCSKKDYTIVKWNKEKFGNNSKKNPWVKDLEIKEAIA